MLAPFIGLAKAIESEMKMYDYSSWDKFFKHEAEPLPMPRHDYRWALMISIPLDMRKSMSPLKFFENPYNKQVLPDHLHDRFDYFRKEALQYHAKYGYPEEQKGAFSSLSEGMLGGILPGATAPSKPLPKTESSDPSFTPQLGAALQGSSELSKSSTPTKPFPDSGIGSGPSQPHSFKESEKKTMSKHQSDLAKDAAFVINEIAINGPNCIKKASVQSKLDKADDANVKQSLGRITEGLDSAEKEAYLSGIASSLIAIDRERNQVMRAGS
jgi:hypothetical protein